MNCPHCGTLNDAQSRFCIKCGQALGPGTGSPGPATSTVGAYSPPTYGRLLAAHTAQALTGLLVLSAFRGLLVGQLPYLESLRLPDVPLSSGAMLNIAVDILLVIVLASYAQALAGLWPRAFSGAAAATPAIVAPVGVAALVIGYRALETLVSVFIADRTALQILQVTVLLIAISLLVWAGLALYRFVPAWVARLQLAPAFAATVGGAQVACLRCGRLNSGEVGFCSQCGNALPAGAGQSGPPISN